MSLPGAGGALRPEVAVGAIVIRPSGHREGEGEGDGAASPAGTEILLVCRGREPGRGLWSVPGGRVEPGERLADAVVREVREETGIAVSVTGFVGWVERIDPAGAWHHVILDFAARPAEADTEPRAGDDADDARWVSTSSLADVDLVAGLLEFLDQHGFTASRVA